MLALAWIGDVMIIIWNGKAFVTLIVGAAITLPLSWGGYLDSNIALILMGLIIMVLDLGIRRPQEAKDLFSTTEGGHLFYIPVWIVGIITMIGFAFFW